MCGIGVTGAAWATVISQGVSGVWVLAFLFGKRSVLHIRREYLVPKAKIVGQIMKLGLSPFFIEVSESAMLACFNNQLLRFGGELAVGNVTILFSLLDFIYLPISGISKGAQPILSYNYGAGRSVNIPVSRYTTQFTSLSDSLFHVLSSSRGVLDNIITSDLRHFDIRHNNVRAKLTVELQSLPAIGGGGKEL